MLKYKKIFKGVIYATEPTLQIGRFFMEELVEFIEQTPKATQAKHWKEMLHMFPPPLTDAIKPKSWRQIYTLAAVNSALSNIQLVGYDQKLVKTSTYKTEHNYLETYCILLLKCLITCELAGHFRRFNGYTDQFRLLLGQQQLADLLRSRKSCLC